MMGVVGEEVEAAGRAGQEFAREAWMEFPRIQYNLVSFPILFVED